jgi:hypothetical protein
MSQKLRGSASPTRALPEHLITGEQSGGEERLIGGDTALAAVMTRADIVCPQRRPRAPVRRDRHGKEIVAPAIHTRVLFVAKGAKRETAEATHVVAHRPQSRSI